MHNLEGISFEEVISDTGVSYHEFRKTLKPDFTTTWLHITGGLLAIVIICIAGWYVQRLTPGWFWLTIPFFALAAGFAIAFVNLFIHEASHFYLHPRKKTNDILANIFLCSWMGIDIKTYRKIHWQHHLHLATPADTENSYFNPITLSLIFETLTGIHLLRIMTNRNNRTFLKKELAKRSMYMLLAGMLINLFIVGIAIFNGHWQFAITWIMAMVVFFPFFATIRQVIEHRDELALNEKKFYNGPKNRVSRIFSGSLFSCIFGGAGFNRHMIHHWDPHLPSTALGHAEKFLLRCNRTRQLIESSRTTYFAVFKKMFSLR